MTNCGHSTHLHRRTLLRAAGLGGLAWLTPVAEALAWQDEKRLDSRPAKSLILLWLEGGPSQLETFDPHPQSKLSDGTGVIETRSQGIQLAAGLEQTADVMDALLVIRNVVSKEGDHERAQYHVKTGYRPDPTLVHPSIGAVVCHELPEGGTEIPRHVSILPGNGHTLGGYLGDEWNAFQLGDPTGSLPDMKAPVREERMKQRLQHLQFADQRFAQRQRPHAKSSILSQQSTIEKATRMMSSEQLRQFDLSDVPQAEKEPFGDTPFGRGCLVAARLIQAGVRCVEVTLNGWDSHITNRDIHDRLKKTLDPALASLIRYLREHQLLDETLVVCGGEFGRTPEINSAGGRDHWPHGFSVAIAGGGIQGGRTIGETAPNGSRIAYEQGTTVADIHTSLLHRLNIDAHRELITPIGRPIKLSEGKLVF